MIEADSVHSTPPTNTSAFTLLETGLAIQQREREKTLQRLAKLRKEASAEIERLLAFLDASDDYVMTECEDGADDGPCDTNELEEDLGSLEPHTKYDFLGRSPWVSRSFDQSRFQGEDAEADDSDDELSLGFLDRLDQDSGLTMGRGGDLEDEHDGAEPSEDAEPSLGWTTSGVLGSISDRELDDCDRESNEPLLTECV
ncbi:hypothetical protein [Bradyrhizobium liaoningense]|uniref:hypothetical protein n=1 Tax=Bradyrhizobium liaoningense TaxID=43992 RepID=UPI001BAC540D|nr:hypothetical protein [Bradyrhizobium liaoningense]MBR0901211.1 hypothetical protein [Bradyrhizobium liaoningense]